jgi:hypothetical protein
MNTDPKPKRLTAKQALYKHHGIKPTDQDAIDGYIERVMFDSEYDTACCEYGCTVYELDGACQHGHPGIVLQVMDLA